MARRFSIGEAIGTPFRLAFKQPVTTTVWGLLSIVPSLIVLAAMVPFFQSAIEQGGMEGLAEAGEPSAGDFETFQQFMAFQAWSGLSNILSLLALLVITCAVIRAVLAGRKGDRFAWVRLGKAEFFVAVVGIAVFVAAMLVLVAGGLVIAGFGITGAATGAKWALWVALALGLALTIGMILLWGRLALIAPATMMTGELAFEEAWKAGKGQTGRLFLMILALFAVSILVGIAVIILFVVCLAIFGGGLAAWTDEAAVEAWMIGQLENPWPWLGAGLLFLIPIAWFQGFSTALWTAPFAVAARDLMPKAGADGEGPAV
jgi:hypothetical protein